MPIRRIKRSMMEVHGLILTISSILEITVRISILGDKRERKKKEERKRQLFAHYPPILTARKMQQAI
jgi:hypothetical protein